MDIKSFLKMRMEDFKKERNNCLEETQENTGKQLEHLKRKHKNPLKSYRKTLPNK
jgi:FtsZ-binding cell division protein ZapB